MRAIRVCLVAALIVLTGEAVGAPGCTSDASQPAALLRLIRSCGSSGCDPVRLEEFLRAPGTALIVAQQNVSRRVTMEQYREAVVAALTGRTADLHAVEGDPRSRRGVEGLVDDVIPGLRWAGAHTELLTARLKAISTLQVCEQAGRLAARHLPVRRVPRANVFVVMGGRAGAAAVAGDIYFDVLAMSYRDATGRATYPTDREVVEYFAHELHHIGYGPVLRAQRAAMAALGGVEGAAYDLLEALLMEGSATYLINWHRDLGAMSKDPGFRDIAPGVDAAIGRLDGLLGAAARGEMTLDQFEAASSEFIGSLPHAIGATLLARIDRTYGNAGVMEVMRDPRRLLARYNAAVARQRGSAAPAFDARTAEWFEALGRRPD